MTAVPLCNLCSQVTDRNESLAGTELATFMERINQLEGAVQVERNKREQFQKVRLAWIAGHE